jgi:hypothetical protein
MKRRRNMKSLGTKLPGGQEIERIFVERIPCSNLLPRDDQSPINTHIPGRSGQFIDAANIQLQIAFRIFRVGVNGAVAVLPVGENVLPINLFLHTFFESMGLDINHRSFLRTHEFNAFLKYVTTLLYAKKSDKNGILRSALWYRDAPGRFNDVPADADGGAGAYTRKVKTQLSALMFLQGKLDLDPFISGKPLVEGVDLDIFLTPSAPHKCLMGAVAAGAVAQEYAIRIEKFMLLVPRIVPKAGLLKQVANYNYTSREVLKFVHIRRTLNFPPRCLHRGEGVPKRVLVVLQAEQQYNGNLEMNPLRFEHHNIEEMMVTVDEREYPYAGGYNVNFTNNDYHESYQQLLADCGHQVDIDVTEYNTDFTVFSFDLTENGGVDEESVGSRRSGEVFVSFKLRGGAQGNIICLCVLERDRVLSFDKNRNFTDANI